MKSETTSSVKNPLLKMNKHLAVLAIKTIIHADKKSTFLEK